MKKFSGALLAAAATLAITPAAMAGTINVDINFGCSGSITGANATGLYAGGANLCTTTSNGDGHALDQYGPGANESGFTKWTQAVGNFTVAGNDLGWNQNQGTANGTNGAGVVGDPSIYGGSGAGSPIGITGTLTVTDGGQSFLFDSVQLKSYGGNVAYTIQGTLNGVTEFDIICHANGSGDCIAGDNASNNYFTVTDPSTDVDVNQVLITLSDANGGYYADNIDLTTTPEPSSLLLLGTGLLGLGLLVRRQMAS